MTEPTPSLERLWRRGPPEAAVAAVPGEAAGKEDRHPPPPAAHSSWGNGRRVRVRSATEGPLPRSWGGGGGQALQRNHVPRLPSPLGPGGPGLQLGGPAEPRGRSGDAAAVLRSRPGHPLELPPRARRPEVRRVWRPAGLSKGRAPLLLESVPFATPWHCF